MSVARKCKPKAPRPIQEKVAPCADLSKADQERVLMWLKKPSGFIQGLCEMGGEPIVLDEWQERIVDGAEPFAIVRKARQVGFSFALACRAVARCYLEPTAEHASIIVSYNLEDAREKMRYVRILQESLPAQEQMKLLVDNAMEIEFSNHNRIIASFRPRGKGKAEILADELAHMTDARGVWQACAPVLSRGDSSARVGSTPLAKAGMFYDMWEGTDGKFSNWKRYDVRWWDSSALCTDVAAAYAAGIISMPTEERVQRFGKPNLKEIFDSMFTEDFQVEYECQWADESESFFPWDLICRASPDGEGAVYSVDTIDGLRFLVGDLYVGMDVGRRRNTTEIRVGEWLPGRERIEERLRIELDNAPFDEQESQLWRILDIPRIRLACIDNNSIGTMLAERAAQRYGSRVMPVDIEGTNKPQIATNMRVMMEKGQLLFSPDIETRQQIHSIKKVVTAHGNVVFNVEKNRKHHADKAWALALMCWPLNGAVKGERPQIIVVNAREDMDEDDLREARLRHRGLFIG